MWWRQAHRKLNEWMLWRRGLESCRVWRKQAVLQSSLAQGYSMSQTIPGQRLHAVTEHGWHVSGSDGSRSRKDTQTDGRTNSSKRTLFRWSTFERQVKMDSRIKACTLISHNIMTTEMIFNMPFYCSKDSSSRLMKAWGSFWYPGPKQ